MNIKDSPVMWRFEDENTDIDISKIEALSSNVVAPIWYSYIPNVDHLMKIKKNDLQSFIDIKDFFIDSDNPEEGKNVLLNECPFFVNKCINILWGPDCGVRLKFDYFLQYWDDFLYPGDESVVICDTENGSNFLQDCDEHIFICKKLNS